MHRDTHVHEGDCQVELSLFLKVQIFCYIEQPCGGRRVHVADRAVNLKDILFVAMCYIENNCPINTLIIVEWLQGLDRVGNSNVLQNGYYMYWSLKVEEAWRLIIDIQYMNTKHQVSLVIG